MQAPLQASPMVIFAFLLCLLVAMARNTTIMRASPLQNDEDRVLIEEDAAGSQRQVAASENEDVDEGLRRVSIEKISSEKGEEFATLGKVETKAAMLKKATPPDNDPEHDTDDMCADTGVCKDECDQCQMPCAYFDGVNANPECAECLKEHKCEECVQCELKDKLRKEEDMKEAEKGEDLEEEETPALQTMESGAALEKANSSSGDERASQKTAAAGPFYGYFVPRRRRCIANEQYAEEVCKSDNSAWNVWCSNKHCKAAGSLGYSSPTGRRRRLNTCKNHDLYWCTRHTKNDMYWHLPVSVCSHIIKNYVRKGCNNYGCTDCGSSLLETDENSSGGASLEESLAGKRSC